MQNPNSIKRKTKYVGKTKKWMKQMRYLKVIPRVCSQYVCSFCFFFSFQSFSGILFQYSTKRRSVLCPVRQFLFPQNELYTFTTLSHPPQRTQDWLMNHYFTLFFFSFFFFFYCSYLLAPLGNFKTKQYFFLMTADVLKL